MCPEAAEGTRLRPSGDDVANQLRTALHGMSRGIGDRPHERNHLMRDIGMIATTKGCHGLYFFKWVVWLFRLLLLLRRPPMLLLRRREGSLAHQHGKFFKSA